MPYTWYQIVSILSCGNNLYRSVDMQAKYFNYKLELMEKGINMTEEIYDKYLSNHVYGFYLNSFPYDVDKNIKHYVLWFHPNFEYNNTLIKKLINFHIDTTNNKFFFFQNKVEIQSVKDIPHIHVFTQLN